MIISGWLSNNAEVRGTNPPSSWKFALTLYSALHICGPVSVIQPASDHIVLSSLFSRSVGPESLWPHAQLGPSLCDPMDCSTPGFPDSEGTISRCLLKLMSIQSVMPSNRLIFCHPLPSRTLSLSQNQRLFQWVSSSHQVAKVLELQHQSFQWIFRTDLLAVQGTLKSLLQHHSWKASIHQHSAFFMV